MKLVKLAHPSQIKSVPDNDLDRYLVQGWCEIKKPASRTALRFRRMRRQRKEDGLKRLAVYLPLEVFAAFSALKLPGETQAELLTRMVRVLRSMQLKG